LTCIIMLSTFTVLT